MNPSIPQILPKVIRTKTSLLPKGSQSFPAFNTNVFPLQFGFYDRRFLRCFYDFDQIQSFIA
jgi:hypothetical protein